MNTLENPFSSYRVWTHSVVITLSSFYFGYNLSAFNCSMDVVAEALDWKENKTLYQTIFTAAYLLGAMMTAACAGSAGNRFGRRKVLMIMSICSIVIHCIHVIPNTWTFGAMRLCAGAIGGFVTTIPPLYLNEISPVQISGRTGSLVQIQLTLGLIIGSLFALALPTDDYSHSDRTHLWMLIFGFPVVFMSLQLALFLTIARHESPIWLIGKGKMEAAQAFYKHIYGPNGGNVFAQFSLSSASQTSIVDFSYASLFCTRKYRKMLHLAIFLQFILQFSGVNVVFTYSATMFDVDIYLGRIIAVVIFVINFISTCISTLFIDKLGRKPVLIVGTLSCGLSLVGSGVAAVFQQAYVCVGFVVMYLVCFEMSLGPVVWIVSGEMLCDGAMSVSQVTGWTCAFVIVLVFPFISESAGIEVCFWIFAAICGFGVAYFSVFLFETKGRKKEENLNYILGDKRAISTERQGYRHVTGPSTPEQHIFS